MSDNEFPPPPYSEREFDQKISEALIISAQQPQAAAEAEEEWEEWNESVFLAAAERITATTVSQREGPSTQTQGHPTTPQASGSIAPLRPHRRGKSCSKPRPSWAEDAEMVPHGNPRQHRSNFSSADSSFSTTAHPWNATESFPDPNYCIPEIRSSAFQPWHIPQSEIPENDQEDTSLPPPPFAAIGPPIDGLLRLEYHPESTPPSPLASPVLDQHPPLQSDPSAHSLPLPHTAPLPRQHINDYFHHAQRVPRHSLPTLPRPIDYHSEQRPTSMQNSRQNRGLPDESQRSGFPLHGEHIGPMLPPPSVQNLSKISSSHTVTNAGGIVVGRSAPQTAHPAANTGSFYKPAVSAQLANSISARPRELPSSQHSLEAARLQPVRKHNVLRSGDHTTFPRTSVITDHNTRTSISTQGVHGSYPQATNASYFPQRPTQHTNTSSTPHRWATSEQQINQSFR